MQLKLLDIEGKDAGQTVTFDWFPIGFVKPSDDNPRLRLNEEIVSGLADVLIAEGWGKISPIAIRPVVDGYEVIDGHHRLEAAIRAGCKSVLGVVHEIDETEAVVQRWLLNQQTEFSDIEKCRYFWKHTKKDSKTGLSRAAFADRLKKTRQTGSNWADVGQVLERLEQCQIDLTLLGDKATHLLQISKAPESDWEWLVSELLKEEWSVKDTEAAVKAVSTIGDIPEWLTSWLDPDKWKRKVIKDENLASSVKRWIDTATSKYEALDADREVWLFDEGGKPYRASIDMRAEFVQMLGDIKTPSDVRIEEKYSAAIKQVEKYENAYEEWRLAQESEENAKRLRQQREKEESDRRIKYSPVGTLGDIRGISFEAETVNAIITDCPYLLSNGGETVRSGRVVGVDKNFEDTDGEAIAPEEWVKHLWPSLVPGGALITTCTQHIRHRLWCVAEELDAHHIYELIWHVKNPAHLAAAHMPQPAHEYIFVAIKKGSRYYAGREEYKTRFGETDTSVISLPKCGDRERIGKHDTQKPIELYKRLITLYCPPEGLILEPFAGSGTTPTAAKLLGRRCTWAEKDETFFNLANERIESTPFHWDTRKN